MPSGRDFLELYAAPGSAALLPWPLAFRWLRWLAKGDGLYAAECAAASREAAEFSGQALATDWAWRHRLVRLVDHADLYLSRTRADAWMDRRIEVRGAWPRQGPFLALTFHWGTGFWSLRHLRRAGYRPAMLSTPVAPARGSLTWRERYGRWRNSEVERASGAPVIYLGGAKTRVREHLSGGGVVVGLLDVPAAQTPASVPVEILGRRSTLPLGLLDIALEAGVPVVLFLLSLDFRTGRRELDILPPLDGLSLEELAAAAAAAFTAALVADPPAWHRWPDAKLFFSASPKQKR